MFLESPLKSEDTQQERVVSNGKAVNLGKGQ